MTIHNLPDPKKAVDIIARAGYLKIENEDLEISLKNHKTISIQPKGNIFGLELSLDSAKITFDTRKLKQPSKPINTKEILDQAIEQYEQESN